MMKCPYCGEEMDVGYISNSKEGVVNWTPVNRRTGWIVHTTQEYEVRLAASSIHKACKCKTYRCKHCKIDIIDEQDTTIPTKEHTFIENLRVTKDDKSS